MALPASCPRIGGEQRVTAGLVRWATDACGPLASDLSLLSPSRSRVEIKEDRVLEGVLIAESLRAGAELAGVPLHVTKIARVEVNNAAAEQPQQWTLLDFGAEEADAERLAERLAACLAQTGAGTSTTTLRQMRSWSSPTGSSATHASKPKAVGRRRTTRAPSGSPKRSWTGRTEPQPAASMFFVTTSRV